MIDVVVSIVNASQRELTLRCLASLERDRDRRHSLETVVLDNASGDGSVEAIRARFPRVRVLEQRHRAGFGANHNAIVRATSSRYVFVLNADTEVPPGTIDALVDDLDAHPHAAVVGPLIRGFDGRQQHSAWRLTTVPVQLVWALTLGRHGAVLSRTPEPRRVGAVSGCAMLVRREALERIGLFDEAYFMFSEEADTARRFEALGLERRYLPTVEILHLGYHATGRSAERHVNETWRSLDRYLNSYHSRQAGRVLRLVTGLAYALALLADTVGKRLPPSLRPSALDASSPDVYRLHVRNAFRGTRDPGLRELAEEWNRQHPADRPDRAPARPVRTGRPG